MKKFLETRYGREITDEALEAALTEANRRRELALKALAFAQDDPPRLSWEEQYALATFGTWVRSEAGVRLLEIAIERLEERRRLDQSPAPRGAPRVLVTGCPLQGDAAKVFKIIEEAGGAVVVQDSCTGIKPLKIPVEEGTGNPLGALAKRYLKIPCSVMTPNPGRLAHLDELIRDYRPDCVVDVVLQFCHTYNVESHTVGEHVKAAHGLPFLKIETDYSPSDMGQLKTRIEALFESL
jgi:benzoyl-CoA reductase/2-hydroxyglutaryl-CoA dehydratase subunit BcrC/BadD/HgdB